VIVPQVAPLLNVAVTFSGPGAATFIVHVSRARACAAPPGKTGTYGRRAVSVTVSPALEYNRQLAGQLLDCLPKHQLTLRQFPRQLAPA